MSRLYRGILVGIVCALILGVFISGYYFGHEVEVISTKTATEYFPVASPFMTVLHIKVVDDNSSQGIANATVAIFHGRNLVEVGQTNLDGYLTTYNAYNSQSELTALVSNANYYATDTLLPIRATLIVIRMIHVFGFPYSATPNGSEKIEITMIVCNPLIESTWHNCWPSIYPAIPPYIQP